MKHLLPKVFFCETITSRVASKAKEAPSLHEVRLSLLDSNPVFQCLREYKKSFSR